MGSAEQPPETEFMELRRHKAADLITVDPPPIQMDTAISPFVSVDCLEFLAAAGLTSVSADTAVSIRIRKKEGREAHSGGRTRGAATKRRGAEARTGC